MAKHPNKNLEDYIEDIDINGLRGRMLRLPSPKSRRREILLTYGSHASIERMYSLAEELNKYGGLSIPDLPGLGGMDSFYKLHQAPSIDAMADYLASFVKMRYKNRRFTIVGVSYGFVVATRMLQKYPDIASKVDLAVSIAGFVHHDDFRIHRMRFLLMKYGALFCSIPFISWFLERCVIHTPIIRYIYKLQTLHYGKSKNKQQERQRLINFEVDLWRINDIRTYFYTAYSMFTADLCNKERVELPVYHTAIDGDYFFDNSLVEQHLSIIYAQNTTLKVKVTEHMPNVIASQREIAPFVPSRLRRILATY